MSISLFQSADQNCITVERVIALPSFIPNLIRVRLPYSSLVPRMRLPYVFLASYFWPRSLVLLLTSLNLIPYL